MSDPTDDKALDEYLKGGSPVSQRYRELGADQVPPDLDYRVLAQARAAVVKRPAAKSRNWIRWSAPLALAASLVMVVTIVIESGVQDETVLTAAKPTADVGAVQSNVVEEQKAVSGSVRDERALVDAPPPPASIEPQFAPSPVPEVVQPGIEPKAIEEVMATAKRSRETPQYSVAPVTAIQMPAPAEAESDAAGASAAVPPTTAIQQTTAVKSRTEARRDQAESSDDLSEVAVTGSRVKRAPALTAGPRNTVPQSRAGNTDEVERSLARQFFDPEQWLAFIRELRKDGRTATADKEWEQFVETFPDYVVSKDDAARKKD